MSPLRSILAPFPRALTPTRIALATIAVVTAAVALPVVSRLDLPVAIGEGASARVIILATTSALAVRVSRAALRATSNLHARLWLALGAAGAGALATWFSYLGVVLVRGEGVRSLGIGEQLFGSFAVGGVLGFLFGTGYAPLAMVARRAIHFPSHDAEDRVVFASGASLLVAAAARQLLSRGDGPDALGWALAAGGLFAMAGATARIVGRVRLVVRARRGLEPGFHLVPRSDAEDERPLVPLVRTRVEPAGVLTATGVSAPYRGARGIFKIGLAPLPSQRFDRPITRLAVGLVEETANAVVTLVLGAGAFLVASPILVVLAFAMGSFDMGTFG